MTIHKDSSSSPTTVLPPSTRCPLSVIPKYQAPENVISTNNHVNRMVRRLAVNTRNFDAVGFQERCGGSRSMAFVSEVPVHMHWNEVTI
jgi:hypothetical protein